MSIGSPIAARNNCGSRELRRREEGIEILLIFRRLTRRGYLLHSRRGIMMRFASGDSFLFVKWRGVFAFVSVVRLFASYLLVFLSLRFKV